MSFGTPSDRKCQQPVTRQVDKPSYAQHHTYITFITHAKKYNSLSDVKLSARIGRGQNVQCHRVTLLIVRLQPLETAASKVLHDVEGYLQTP